MQTNTNLHSTKPARHPLERNMLLRLSRICQRGQLLPGLRGREVPFIIICFSAWIIASMTRSSRWCMRSEDSAVRRRREAEARLTDAVVSSAGEEIDNEKSAW